MRFSYLPRFAFAGLKFKGLEPRYLGTIRTCAVDIKNGERMVRVAVRLKFNYYS